MMMIIYQLNCSNIFLLTFSFPLSLPAGGPSTLSNNTVAGEFTDGSNSSQSEQCLDQDIQHGHLSVYIHKRQDQSSHDVIQPLLR